MKNLNEIAREVLVEEGRITPHKLQQLMQLGSRAMRELNIDITGTLKTIKIKPNNYRAIPVPSDYYTYSKLGLCENGMIYNLGLNNDLCFPDTLDSCGQLQPERFAPDTNTSLFSDNFTDGGWGWYYWNFNTINENGEFIGKLYGQGSGHNPLGEYRFNDETREFIVTPTLQGKEIVLEYISTGMNQENILVPDEAVEAVISFIKWKKSVGAARQQYKSEYEQNVSHLRLRKFSFTGEEFIAAVRRGYFRAPKQ